MRVKIFDITGPGQKQFRCECDIAECFPDDAETAWEAHQEIRRCGQSWHGGGAAPAIILEEAERIPATMLQRIMFG